MSKHPKPKARLKQVWTTPRITKIDLKSAPYADVIHILRSTLKQAERDISLNPNDTRAAEIARSLRRMLNDLEAGKGSSAA